MSVAWQRWGGDVGTASVTRQSGRIGGRAGKDWIVSIDAGPARARRAVSCLVEPRIDDLVVVERLVDGRAYIAAVLERAEDDVLLAVDGDIALRAGGRLALASRQGVDVVSSEVSIDTGSVSVRAHRGHAAFSHLRIVSACLDSSVERLKSFAQTADHVVGRFSMKAKRAIRRVEELDELRAGRIEHQARTTLSLRGRDTLMASERLTKVDGEQVHLG